MKEEKGKIIILALSAGLILVLVWMLTGDSNEIEIEDSIQVETSEEDSFVEKGISESDPIGQVISEEVPEQIKVINECLGTNLYSNDPEEMIENLTDGKKSVKDILIIGKNYHGFNLQNEKLIFSYKRLEFEKKEVFDLKVVKELSDGSVQSVEYNGEENLETIRSYFEIQEFTLEEEIKAFSGAGMSLYYTQDKTQIKELSITVQDKVVNCELKKCLCR